MAIPQWASLPQFSAYLSSGFYENLEGCLSYHALQTSQCVYKFDVSNKITMEEASKLAEQFQMQITLQKSSAEESVETEYVVYTNETTILELRVYKNDTSVSFATLNLETYTKLQEELLKFQQKIAPAEAYILLPSRDGLDVRVLGKVQHRAKAEYYNDHTWIEFTEWLASYRDSSAKLSIIAGPPGVGKTHLVYEVIHTDTSAKTIFTDATTFQFNHKDLVSALLDHGPRGKTLSKRTLVIEDGDQLLAKRNDGNRAAVEFLLNITDGVLAEALDLRVILTTNLPTRDIDEAVMRPGRCNKILRVENLTPEKFQALTAKHGSGSLAEALNARAEITPKRKVGFGS